MEKILVGYRKFTSKAGTDCCICSILSDYSERDKQFGAVGQKVDEVFIPSDSHKLITPDKIMASCVLLYGEGSNGKPSVTGIKFLDK